MRFELWGAVCEIPVQFPWFKIAVCKWAYKGKPKFGFCPVPPSMKGRFNAGDKDLSPYLDMLEPIFRWVHTEIPSLQELTENLKVKVLANLDYGFADMVMSCPLTGPKVKELPGKLGQVLAQILAHLQKMRDLPEDKQGFESLPNVEKHMQNPSGNQIFAEASIAFAEAVNALNTALVDKAAGQDTKKAKAKKETAPQLDPMIAKFTASGALLSEGPEPTWVKNHTEVTGDEIPWYDWVCSSTHAAKKREETARHQALTAINFLFASFPKIDAARYVRDKEGFKVLAKADFEPGQLVLPVVIMNEHSLMDEKKCINPYAVSCWVEVPRLNAAAAASSHGHGETGCEKSAGEDEGQGNGGMVGAAQSSDSSSRNFVHPSLGLEKLHFKIVREHKLPKKPEAGEDHKWEPSDAAHLFWAIPTTDKEGEWNFEVRQVSVRHIATLQWGQDQLFKKQGPLVDTRNTSLPVLVNITKLSKGDQMLRKGYVKPKAKAQPKVQTWQTQAKDVEHQKKASKKKAPPTTDLTDPSTLGIKIARIEKK